MLKRLSLLSLLTVCILVLGACSQTTEEDQTEDTNNKELQHDTQSHDMKGMNHSGSGEVPEDLKVAENPTFKVGSHAILKDGHMEGMKSAEATIIGAYDTTAYRISYNPATGGERVKNHKWIIHEEIKDSGEESLQPGAEAITTASHMDGMKGTTVKIESAQETTVYMIDYKPTTGGEEVTNHKWVTDDELMLVE
ncbi:YdhK family protein [Pradoshia sp. D12]|uniref:YdhK family protein n=1 Tax=Bacillaceae TaxID=186817 RepID=UPI00112C0EA3|nr:MULTISPECIES: YdhK family protein [Bacillaceae]QFK70681.1 YdhK family protein [Pradoshia sp. D12]TPF72476.1 DUF1541 domain-containing protein [Bacillus sp. D12]